MKIICDRCEKEITDVETRKEWLHIETSEKGYGKLCDYYLCPKCKNSFYKWMDEGKM